MAQYLISVLTETGELATDAEMAAVLTFIRNTWGNAAPPVTTRDVSGVRSAIHK